MKIALIEKFPTKIDYSEFFEFEYDHLYLRDTPKEKILKKDIELEFDPSEYNYVILVGSEAAKFIGKISSVVKYQGYLVEDKYLPIVNPSMVKLKPEGLPAFNKAVTNIHKYIAGELVSDHSCNISLLETEEEVLNYIVPLLNNNDITHIAVDTETYLLDPRSGYILGISISHELNQGVYFTSDLITEEVEQILRHLFASKTCIFHNSKYDIQFLTYQFNFEFPKFEDTMLLHYCLDETTGSHDLKSLAIKHTEFGDYEADLEQWKSEYCKKHKVKKTDFTYDLIPLEILWPYAAKDTAVTLQLYEKFYPAVSKDTNLWSVYNDILIPGTKFFIKMENNGVPFDKNRLKLCKEYLSSAIQEATESLYQFEATKAFEAASGKKLNTNSVYHLRDLLFNYAGLTPTGILTDTGQHSTNEEALTLLAEDDPIAENILYIRKLTKLKNTYIEKILIGLDSDSRLRTGFHLHTTTSGRASSSGKLNMQQLPRDEKKIKACIRAGTGSSIISQDLGTAEIYIVAALCGDTKLHDIFRSGKDFHSSIGKMVFNLQCPVEEVKTLHPQARQISKTLAFAILYGAGIDKVAASANISEPEAKELIEWYFATFKTLDKWLTSKKKEINANGYIYSVFGRKRRVPNIFSSNRAVSGHARRSAINFLVQSVASDINLMASIQMQTFIEQNKMDSKIFALVHDSIVAEVPDSEQNIYIPALKGFTQKNYGVMIPDCPIGVDVEIGNDYSFKEGIYEC